jgi:hypothetical protein
MLQKLDFLATRLKAFLLMKEYCIHLDYADLFNLVIIISVVISSERITKEK